VKQITARQILRRNRVGAFLTVVGILLFIAVVIATVFYGRNYFPTISKNTALLIGIGVVLAVFASITASIELDAKYCLDAYLIRRWKKLTGLPIEQFPLTKAEREALKDRWARWILEDWASYATNSFSARDRDTQNYLEFVNGISRPSAIPQIKAPEDLIEERKNLAEAQQGYDEQLGLLEWAKSNSGIAAQTASDIYNAYWDFFGNMRVGDGNMLPMNPTTGKPWENPNNFRLSLAAAAETPETPEK
jgi:hypothetical protein